MKGTIRIEEINYGDVAIKVLPLMRQAGEKQAGAVGKTILAISNLPDKLIYDLFDAIPVEQKNEIVAAFAMENKDRLVSTVNKLSSDYHLGITLSDFTVNQDMEFTAVVEKIDYQTIAERFLPELREKLLGMGGMIGFLKPVIERATAEQVCGLLDKILGNQKESIIVSLINKNQQKLISLIEDTARKQNINLKIHSFTVEV